MEDLTSLMSDPSILFTENMGFHLFKFVLSSYKQRVHLQWNVYFCQVNKSDPSTVVESFLLLGPRKVKQRDGRVFTLEISIPVSISTRGRVVFLFFLYRVTKGKFRVQPSMLIVETNTEKVVLECTGISRRSFRPFARVHFKDNDNLLLLLLLLSLPLILNLLLLLSLFLSLLMIIMIMMLMVIIIIITLLVHRRRRCQVIRSMSQPLCTYLKSGRGVLWVNNDTWLFTGA